MINCTCGFSYPDHVMSCCICGKSFDHLHNIKPKLEPIPIIWETAVATKDGWHILNLETGYVDSTVYVSQQNALDAIMDGQPCISSIIKRIHLKDLLSKLPTKHQP